MSKEFTNWQEVIIDFFENRISKSKLFMARKYIADQEDKIKKEKDEKKLTKLRIARDEKRKELIQLRVDAPAAEIRDWIEQNYNKPIPEGDRTMKATHVLKFTHSSSDAGGLLLKDKSDDFLLSTASFKRKLTLDLAHKNGAHISISRFLGLKLSGEMVIDCILHNNFAFLNAFKKDKEQFEKWKNGFSNMVEIREIKTMDKAKQLYFPLDNSLKEYHLVTPLFASSLCNEVDTVISNVKYKEQKEINKYRNNKKDNKNAPKYHQYLYTDYPNLAVQNFGGKYARNVSMLNADRSGKAYLLSAQPPTWQSHLKPPINKKSLFDNYHYSPYTIENIRYLVEFLLRNEGINLSIRHPEKQKWLKKWINYIIDDFLIFIGNIQNLPPGWSNTKGIKLKHEHRYLLDPYREDQEFQANRKNTDWQKNVVNDFSTWLNRQLKNMDKKFTPQNEYSRTWKKVMKKELREYNQIIDANIAVEVSV